MSQEELHVTNVPVMQCSRLECAGTEKGCDSGSCGTSRGFRYWSHTRFEDTFKRCPLSCKAASHPKPGGLKERIRPTVHPQPMKGHVVKWKRDR